MARKASPAVQIKNLDAAMAKLDLQDRIHWLIKAVGSLDSESMLIAGIMEALELFEEKKFPAPPDYNVNGVPMTTKKLIDMAWGYGEPKALINAIDILEDQGFTVEPL